MKITSMPNSTPVSAAIAVTYAPCRYNVRASRADQACRVTGEAATATSANTTFVAISATMYGSASLMPSASTQ